MRAKPELIIFAKAPLLGQVKTRLAATIGDWAALAFYRQTLTNVLSRLDGGGPWQTRLAVTPDAAVGIAHLWPTATPRVPQGPGNLGTRMARFLAQAERKRPIVIVGSDIPDLTAAHVKRAFEALRQHHLVLGPATDGGYWLIGAGMPPPKRLFTGVRWSTEHARADTLRNAVRLEVTLIDELEDVDDQASYERFMASAGRQP